MAGRMEAQARVDRIRAFQQELAELESELGPVLDDPQRQRVARHHEQLLAELERQYDVSTTTADRQLALGLRFASFLGALALCIAIVLFVERFWGGLTTGVQVSLLALATAAALGLTEFAARREKTLYFAGLAALVAFAAFVTDVSILGQVYNLIPSHHGFLLWAVFAGALAYGYGLRMLLLAALITGTVWMAGALASAGGLYWTGAFTRSELFLPAAALAAGLGLMRHRPLTEGFCWVYRVFGLAVFFYIVVGLSQSARSSFLPLSVDGAEIFYQVVGFVAAGLAIWGGIRQGWREVTNIGVAAFTALMLVKAADWWWDWMPHWLFFLVLGGIAVVVMLLLKRFKAQIGRAS